MTIHGVAAGVAPPRAEPILPQPHLEASAVSRIAPPVLIQVDQIKTILYMGIRGEVNLEVKLQPHQVDTFA